VAALHCDLLRPVDQKPEHLPPHVAHLPALLLHGAGQHQQHVGGLVRHPRSSSLLAACGQLEECQNRGVWCPTCPKQSVGYVLEYLTLLWLLPDSGQYLQDTRCSGKVLVVDVFSDKATYIFMSGLSAADKAVTYCIFGRLPVRDKIFTHTSSAWYSRMGGLSDSS
jgi:hypothetical protein